jgi:DNA-binding beta-propeller fold protein YncE
MSIGNTPWIALVALLCGACSGSEDAESSSGSPDAGTPDGSGGTAGTGGTGGAGGTGGSGGANLDASWPDADAQTDGPVEAEDGAGEAGPEGGQDAALPAFTKGHVFIAGSRNAEVFEFDHKLDLVDRWTHPKFGQVLPAPGQGFQLGPAGMAFDSEGRLVVATLTDFCVFSEPGVELACYPKVKEQPTENVIFDSEGHLFTTTSTGGTNEVHKYDDTYQHLETFSAPTGELTGITCDPQSNLYVASQTGSCLYKFDRTTLDVLDTIPVSGSVEGLQFSGTNAIYVAAHQGVPAIQRVQAQAPGSVLSTIALPDFAFPVPITTDSNGYIYVADYENGSGTAPADLYVVSPVGDIVASRLASEVYGPFGIVVAGVELPCGAYRPSN